MNLPGRTSRYAHNERRAIIDIGSNTVRLVIYAGPPRTPAVLYNEKITARLGKGVAENGQLAPKASGAALAALGRYAALLDLQGVRDVQTVATAAVRDAGNGAQFLEQVAALGLHPRLLSGEEEALAGATGVQAAFPRARGVVGDLGGGSLELTDIVDGQCQHGSSMPLGTLHLAQMRAADPAKFSARVHKLLGAADWSERAGLPFYLVGGAWRALARYAMHQQDWPLDDPHGFEMTPEGLQTLARSLGQVQGKLKADVPGLSASRLASLPDAAALLAVLTRELQPAKLVFSSWGLREGLLHGKLDPVTQAQDPMTAGIIAFAEGCGTPASLGAMVAGWTAAANPTDGRGGESLRLSATLLALASMRVEPNMRADQAVDWALRKRWVGVDAQGRAMLAAAMLANAGRSTIPPALDRLADAASLREAFGWGLAIRLCRRFSGCSPQSLSNSMLRRDGTRLMMTVREPLHALYTETVEKDLRGLATWLGLEPTLQMVRADAPLS